jgi:hypothetical protein
MFQNALKSGLNLLNLLLSLAVNLVVIGPLVGFFGLQVLLD